MANIECKTRDGHRAVVVRLYKGPRAYPLEVRIYSKWSFGLIPATILPDTYTIDGQYLGYGNHPLDLVSGDKKWLT